MKKHTLYTADSAFDPKNIVEKHYKDFLDEPFKNNNNKSKDEKPVSFKSRVKLLGEKILSYLFPYRVYEDLEQHNYTVCRSNTIQRMTLGQLHRSFGAK
jgi:hypothetical protein